MAVGPFTQEDLGIACYHSKTGAVELILNHLIDKEKEYILVDMTAGADAFASGLFTRFDITYLVVEPTLKSVGVWKQYKQYAGDFDLDIKVIGNKIESQDDIDFLKKHVGSDLVGWLSVSPFVKNWEKGQIHSFELEPKNIEALDKILQNVDSHKKDWKKYYEQMIIFHKRNAISWANAQAGRDLTEQIDPQFSLDSVVR
jgi:CO dehydrogenase maturation factor